jgi:hypothetical protein
LNFAWPLPTAGTGTASGSGVEDKGTIKIIAVTPPNRNLFSD